MRRRHKGTNKPFKCSLNNKKKFTPNSPKHLLTKHFATVNASWYGLPNAFGHLLK